MPYRKLLEKEEEKKSLKKLEHLENKEYEVSPEFEEKMKKLFENY